MNIELIPSDYADASVIAREAGEGMLARLGWMTMQPKVIVDMGCGTAEMSAKLQARYPNAQVIALDISETMLRYAQQNIRDRVCSDAEKLPLRDQSVDLIFANFMLPWHANVDALLREFRRVLRAEGLLIFTAFGPDTLREYRHIFGDKNLPHRVDMHNVGDGLLQAGFADPVADVDYYTTSFREKNRLMHELRASGMLLSNAEFDVPANAENTWEITYEIVHAHAWKAPESDTHAASEDGVVRVPVSVLKRKIAEK